MFNFTIPANFILGLSVFAPVKEVRYYLKGVCVTCKNNKLSLVATNGSLLGCLDKNEVELPDFEFIISHESIKMLSIFKGKNITFKIDGDKLTANDLQITPIDGKFPCFERVLHESNHIYSDEPVNIDFELLSQFSKFAKTIGNSKFAGHWWLKHNGEDGSVGVVAVGKTKEIILENGFTWRGVVMPLKSNHYD